MGPLTLIGLLSIAWICFCFYFFVKALGFVMNATNLYRSMIARQDSIISLLIDIRDSTKNTNINAISALLSGPISSENSNIETLRVTTGDAESDKIIQTYLQIKSQYGSSLSDFGIILKLEELLKMDSGKIKAVLAKYDKLK